MHAHARKPKTTQQNTSAKPPTLSRTFRGQGHDVRSAFSQATRRLPQAESEQIEVGPVSDASTGFGHDFSRVLVHPPTERAMQAVGKIPLQGKTNPGHSPAQMQADLGETANHTGMPSRLKSGLEALSGMDMSGVRVHRNSAKPAQVDALAYTQGQDIYVGQGQEKHLPHEGWHVVQQMQGRVKPTMQAEGVSINDDMGLEREADEMGAKALQVKTVEKTSVNPQQISDTGHVAGSPRSARRADRDSAVCSPSSVLIQRIAVAPAAVAAAIEALTLAEAISAVGTIVGTAVSIVGLVGAAQNDKTGKSPDAILTPKKGDYLMSDPDRDGLAQVFRVLYLAEAESLVKRELSKDTVLDDAKKEQLKQTALGNVKLKLSVYMSNRLLSTSKSFVQNGDGRRMKETPWGEVTVSVEGSMVPAPSTSSPGVVKVAERYHVKLPELPLHFIKRVQMSYKYEKDWNLTWSDDIWVRCTKLSETQTQGPGKHVGIEAEVAFDWDGDTSWYEWAKAHNNLITFGNIPEPHWGGSTDPDD